jgi:hypothetical protein
MDAPKEIVFPFIAKVIETHTENLANRKKFSAVSCG